MKLKLNICERKAFMNKFTKLSKMFALILHRKSAGHEIMQIKYVVKLTVIIKNDIFHVVHS